MITLLFCNGSKFESSEESNISSSIHSKTYRNIPCIPLVFLNAYYVKSIEEWRNTIASWWESCVSIRRDHQMRLRELLLPNQLRIIYITNL